MKTKDRKSKNILRYINQHRQDSRTLRKAYIQWRKNESIPLRCDNEICQFFNNPLTWNKIELPLILDHINGVNSDNRPKNLRFLCPNCNSQLDTNGGKNRGKTRKSSGGFGVKDKNGLWHYTMPIETGCYTNKFNG